MKMRNLKEGYILDKLRAGYKGKYYDLEEVTIYNTPNGQLCIAHMPDGRRLDVTQEVKDIARKPAIDYFLSHF